MPQGLRVKTPEEILSGPDYFFCKQFKCAMHRRQCLINQERGRKSASLADQYKRICLSCETGKVIRTEFKGLLKEIKVQLRDSLGFTIKTKADRRQSNPPVEQREKYTKSEEQMTKKKDPNKKEVKRIFLYLDDFPELYEWIRTQAEADERDIKQQTRFILKQAMAADQNLSPRANAA